MLLHKFSKNIILAKTNFRFLSQFGAATSITNLTATVEHVDRKEIEHHGKMASDWWNKNGIMKALHSMNEIRVPLIRDGLIATGIVQGSAIETTKVLENIKILEVGCGGGILTEQLARIHAHVTAIDLGHEVIATAKEHLESESSELSDRISYNVESIEEHSGNNQEKYDAVVVSEVLEHVTDKQGFLKSCVSTVKPNGSIFITTPNRTFPMWLGGIILAEYVLQIAPKGTHHYEKFITPLETQRVLDSLNCTTILVNGCVYEFWRNAWTWTPNTTFCYAIQAVKN